MKLTRLLALAVLTLPVLAHAHPGHDDPEFTWDLGHVVSHPVATVLCLGLLAVGSWTIWRLLRPIRAKAIPAKSRR